MDEKNIDKTDVQDAGIKKAMRFSKKVVVLMLISVLIFTLGMVAIYLFTGAIPDTLVTEFYSFFKIEGGVLGIISVGKKLTEWLSNKTEKRKRRDCDDLYINSNRYDFTEEEINEIESPAQPEESENLND